MFQSNIDTNLNLNDMQHSTLFRSLLALAAVISAGFSMSQPVLSVEDIAPALGETYTQALAQGEEADVPMPGAAQSWDFSEYTTPMFQFNFEAILPSEVPGGPSVPGADLVLKAETGFGGDNYGYYEVGSSEVGIIHSYNSQFGSTEYTDPDEFGGFPWSYESSYSGTYRSEQSVSGITTVDSAEYTIDYIGYGTLTTAAGTFQNVALLRRSGENVSTTVFMGTAMESSSYDIEDYIWYKPGIHYALAQVSVDTEEGMTTYGVSWLANPNSTSSIAGNDFMSSLKLYPVPARSQLQLNGISGMRSNLTYKVYDITGRMVLNGNLPSQTGNASVDVSGLRTGSYVLVIMNDEGRTARRFSKE